MTYHTLGRFRNWASVNRLGLAATIRSISWLSADNFVTTLMAAGVSIVVARTLGTDAVGTWGYAFALYSLALIVATLGTDQILILDLVGQREMSPTILTTALALRLGASLLCATALVVIALSNGSVANIQNQLTLFLAAALVAMALDVSGSPFRSQQRFNRVVLPSIATTVAGSIAKAWLVIRHHSVLPLGQLTLAQNVALQGLILWSLISDHQGNPFGAFSWQYARALLRASIPLMLSGVAVFVYLRANIFFLNELGGKTEVGLYSAAAAISGVTYFIPTVIVTALTPALFRRYAADRVDFERSFRHLTTLLTLGLATVAAVLMLLAPHIIVTLYGPAFTAAAPALALHAWTLLPVAYGLSSSVWLAAEKRTTVLFVRTACGGAVNVVLNLLLIPRFGIVGAAMATLAAMFTASMLMLLFFGPVPRRILWIQLRSLLLIDVFAALLRGRSTAASTVTGPHERQD